MEKQKPIRTEIILPQRAGLSDRIDLASAPDAIAGHGSPNTRRAYAADLRQFFGTEDLGRLTLDDFLRVQPQAVVLFRDKLVAEGWKPATISRKLSAIRSLFNNLFRLGKIRINPADPKLVRAPKRPSVKHTDFLTWEEAKKLLARPDRGTDFGKRDYAILLTFVRTGLRREELCTLRDENLRTSAGVPCIVVRGKGGKERIFRMGEAELKAIDAWRSVRRADAEWLFTSASGKRFTERDCWRMLRRYANESGLEPDRKLAKGERYRVHPHALRAAFIWFLHDKGMPLAKIQQLVGHEKGDTTLGYIRQLDLLKSEAPEMLDGLD